MSVYLHEKKWCEVKDETYRVAILPWGATEAHNLHLPYGTDTLLASDIAGKSCELANLKGAKAVVLPAIPYGVNTGQREVALCMNLYPSTQQKILDDILETLSLHNVNRLIILNAHGGNMFQPIIRELSVKYPKVLISMVNWWRAASHSKHFTHPDDHAGELETSSMMYLFPTITNDPATAGDGKEHHLLSKGFREKWAWTPRRWIYTTEDTGVGYPKEATAQKGEAFVEECCRNIADFIIEFSKANSERDLYEK